MSVWVHKNGPVTIAVDRESFGFIVQGFAPQVNFIAEVVASEARSILPTPSMARFIGVKRAGVIEGSNTGVWRMRMRGRRYGSGSGNPLMRGVEAPVALVVNNSNLAMTWEYGSVAQKSVAFARKNGGAPGHKGATKGQRALGGANEFRMWQPLTLGAMRAQAGGRLILKYRRPRGGR